MITVALTRALTAILILFFFADCNSPDSAAICNASFEKIDSLYDLKIQLNVFYDLEQAKKCSEITGKPILTIYGCYACVGDPNVMWEIVNVNEIHKIVSEKFILNYLYVDDKKPVNDSINQIIDFNGKRIQNIGQFNSNRQITRYKAFYQPMYTITNYKDIDLTEPIGYTTLDNKKSFEEFLTKGLKKRY